MPSSRTGARRTGAGIRQGSYGGHRISANRPNHPEPQGDRGTSHMSKRFIGSRQTTIGREIELSGTGVHSGAPVSMVLHPAEADAGYRFLVSKRGRIIAEIPADVRYVKNLTLCTVLGDEA